MEWGKIIGAGDVRRILASFISVTVMLTLTMPLEPIFVLTANAVLSLFLAHLVVLRCPDTDGQEG
jgi:hypothetical protein